MIFTKQGYALPKVRPDVMKIMMDDLVPALLKLQEELKFTHMAVSGSSGIGFGCAASLLTGIPLIYVRKEAELKDSHGSLVEAHGECTRYIVLDDFVAGGTTVRRIVDTIARWDMQDVGIDEEHMVCVGIAEYALGEQMDEHGLVDRRTLRLGDKPERSWGSITKPPVEGYEVPRYRTLSKAGKDKMEYIGVFY